MATFGDSPGEINVGAEATPVYRSQDNVGNGYRLLVKAYAEQQSSEAMDNLRRRFFDILSWPGLHSGVASRRTITRSKGPALCTWERRLGRFL
jgi:hypothetical protein